MCFELLFTAVGDGDERKVGGGKQQGRDPLAVKGPLCMRSCLVRHLL